MRAVKDVPTEELERYLRITQYSLERLNFIFELNESFEADYVFVNQRTKEVQEGKVQIDKVVVDGIEVPNKVEEYWAKFSTEDVVFEEKTFADAKANVTHVLGRYCDYLRAEIEKRTKWLKFRQSDFSWDSSGRPYLVAELGTGGIRGLERRTQKVTFYRTKKIGSEFFLIFGDEFRRQKDKYEGTSGFCVFRFPTPVEKAVTEAFEQHEVLNQKLWDGEQLKKEVREHLFDILAQYIVDSAFLEQGDIITAIIVGSNAAYNYTDSSDLDLHLVVDMSSLSSDPKFVQLAADGEKAAFNRRYDLQLAGIGVELYVEDVSTSVVSNGVYDLFEDRWVKKPDKYTVDIDYAAYDSYYQKIRAEAEQILLSDNAEEIQAFIDELYKKRKFSLLQYGEPGDDNQVFKDLRNEGLIEKLKEKVNELKSRELSIEESILEALEKPSKKN